VVAEYAVERKTIRDFLASVYSGRLFEQAQRISGAYKEYLLIVEGDTREMLADLRNPKIYWGALLVLLVNFEFKIFFTLDRHQISDFLHALWTKSRGKATVRPLLVKKPRMATIKDRQLSVLESLPTIGPKLGERLLASFG
jgi:DNA excision repair protein ERCC-4